jgi:hypothetical protein
MVLTWCKVLARALRGRLRSEAQPEPRCWRGEPLAAGGQPAASTDANRTLSFVRVPAGPAGSGTEGQRR